MTLNGVIALILLYFT